MEPISYYNRKNNKVQETRIISAKWKICSWDELKNMQEQVKWKNQIIVILKSDANFKTYSEKCFHAIIKNNP